MFDQILIKTRRFIEHSLQETSFVKSLRDGSGVNYTNELEDQKNIKAKYCYFTLSPKIFLTRNKHIKTFIIQNFSM